MDPQAMAAMASMPADLPMFKAGPMSLMPNAEFGNRADTLAADIPAGGKTSARAVARMYAALLGEVDGVRLVSPARLSEATTAAFSGIDEVFGMPTTWSLGFGIGRPGAMDSRSAFGVGGVGGSFAYGDTSSGVAFAMTKNRLTQDFNAAAQLTQLVTDALK
jgi:CubicO group peptidase (beta-lactamase class C family)